jgi:hypothetical protein
LCDLIPWILKERKVKYSGENTILKFQEKMKIAGRIEGILRVYLGEQGGWLLDICQRQKEKKRKEKKYKERKEEKKGKEMLRKDRE